MTEQLPAAHNHGPNHSLHITASGFYPLQQAVAALIFPLRCSMLQPIAQMDENTNGTRDLAWGSGPSMVTWHLRYWVLASVNGKQGGVEVL